MSVNKQAALSCRTGMTTMGKTPLDGFVRCVQRTRKPRTSWIQAVSSSNDIARMRERQDELYQYDAWTAHAGRALAGGPGAALRAVLHFWFPRASHIDQP